MNKLERVKRFLSRSTRPGLRVMSLALLATGAYASSIVVVSLPTEFAVTGTFQGGDPLSGYFVLNSGGAIATEDLTVVDSGTTYTFTTIGSQGAQVSGNYYFDNSTSSGAILDLDIYIGSASNLSGYTGGALCSIAAPCSGTAETSFTPTIISVSQPAGDPPLGSGTTSATPEPSTALLSLAAGSAFLALRRRKRTA